MSRGERVHSVVFEVALVLAALGWLVFGVCTLATVLDGRPFDVVGRLGFRMLVFGLVVAALLTVHGPPRWLRALR